MRYAIQVSHPSHTKAFYWTESARANSDPIFAAHFDSSSEAQNAITEARLHDAGGELSFRVVRLYENGLVEAVKHKA